MQPGAWVEPAGQEARAEPAGQAVQAGQASSVEPAEQGAWLALGQRKPSSSSVCVGEATAWSLLPLGALQTLQPPLGVLQRRHQ